MRIVFYIPDEKVSTAYQELKLKLVGAENILFDSMNVIHPTFSAPTNQAQYPAKFIEMEKILQRKAIGGGQDLNFRLFEEVFDKLHINGFGTLNREEFRNNLRFEIQHKCLINLSDNNSWLYENSLAIIKAPHNFEQKYVLTIHNRTLGKIVPEYIIQYFHTAINCFKENLYPVCLALISIIVEGTLKDVLLTRGYTFDYANRSLPNYVGGLGGAINKARNVENFLTASDFPMDLDLVIKPIRNNLIHLSGDAYNTRLPYLDNYEGISNFTIGHFIKDPVLVNDLLISVAGLIEKLYMDLRNSGHLIP